MCAKVLAFVVFLTGTALGFNWNENVRPKVVVNYLQNSKSDNVFNFLGNQTHKDHFKLLQIDGGSLLIGARNVIYNLSLDNLRENIEQRITWDSQSRDREMCQVKGRSEDECQNYIRVMAKTDSSRLLVCGTNSFNPKCRTYSSAVSDDTNNKTTTTNNTPLDDEYKMIHEFSGKGYCPPDPKHNSTAIFTGGELYSGTVSDFSASDALIYRDNLRTEQYDLKHLNSPDFVGSAEDEDYVYFFFRESAVEYINCGKSIYSRVARVCKNDRGGPHKFQHRWTTFLKARLNCSVPGDIPFYFNEIQGATDFIDVAGGKDKLVYAVFTTPENAVSGSAICSFKLSDIKHAFDEGQFKGQATGNSNWLPVKVEEANGLRPGQCIQDSTKLSESNLNFIKQHSLMDEAVPSSKIRANSAEVNFDAGNPIFVKTSLNERLTVVAVDPQIKTPSGESYDVIYAGSTDGKVFKIVSVFEEKHVDDKVVIAHKPVIVEEVLAFPNHIPVRNLHVLNGNDTTNNARRLVVLSDSEVKSIPLYRCSRYTNCSSCVALQDPHCAWNTQTRKCVSHDDFQTTDSNLLLQDVFHGRHSGCAAERDMPRSFNLPQPVVGPRSLREEALVVEEALAQPTNLIDISIEVEEDEENETPTYELPVHQEPEVLNGGSTFIAAIVTTAFACLVIGFAAGWFASRKWSKDDYRSCGHRYLEAQQAKNRENAALNRPVESSYSTAPCNNLGQNNDRNNIIAQFNKNKTRVTTELEKNNLNNALVMPPPIEAELVADLTPIKSLDTSAHYSTLQRSNGTGTLCKKVYL